MSRRFRTEFCRTVRPWRRYDQSVLLTTEPIGTGLALGPPVNGDWRGAGAAGAREMPRDNSAAYIALSAVVVRGHDEADQLHVAAAIERRDRQTDTAPLHRRSLLEAGRVSIGGRRAAGGGGPAARRCCYRTAGQTDGHRTVT